MAQTLSHFEHKHHQYLFDRIYKHVHTKHFESLHKRSDDPTALLYLMQEKGTYYLRASNDLWEILKLLDVSPNYQEIPYYIQKQIPRRTLEKLLEDIPRSRILYADRYQTTPYRFNLIETREIKRRHLDGNPIPSYIKNIYIHKIFKFQDSYVKIWELVPYEIKHPTPVCLIPGFVSNYYSFHFEGNMSFDYHLVRSGSRLFILDHDRKDEDANIDVYAEYLTTTMMDFVIERTNSPQVILGGHSMGGLIAICKAILDTVRRPRFITAIKALIIINSPVHFNEDYWVPNWFIHLGEIFFDIAGRHGTIPIEEFVRVLRTVPFLEYGISADFSSLVPHVQKLPLLRRNKLLKKFLRMQWNPFSNEPKTLRVLAKHALTNPPRMVVQQWANVIKQNTEGFTSYYYEEANEPIYEEGNETLEKRMPVQNTGINYTENLYRISPAIPLLIIQTKDDVVSPPEPCFRYWDRWAHSYKLRLEHDPDQPQKAILDNIQEFIQQRGLSTAIGVTVTRGRHIGALQTEKRVVSTFIAAVEQTHFSPLSLVKTGIHTHRVFIRQKQDMAHRFIFERDLAKKIRYIDPHVFWAERQAMINILIDLMSSFKPYALIDENFQNFMVRDAKTIEDRDDIRYNVLHNCVITLLAFKPDPLHVITKVHDLVTRAGHTPDAACFRSLIDLSLGVFDTSKKGLPEKRKEFLKRFETFLDFSMKQPESSVALHAFRAFFHTRDDYFVKKGGSLYSQLPESWRERAHQIYWDEIQKRIEELKDVSIETMNVEMRPFLEVMQQIVLQN